MSNQTDTDITHCLNILDMDNLADESVGDVDDNGYASLFDLDEPQGLTIDAEGSYALPEVCVDVRPGHMGSLDPGAYVLRIALHK